MIKRSIRRCGGWKQIVGPRSDLVRDSCAAFLDTRGSDDIEMEFGQAHFCRPTFGLVVVT